MKKPSVIIETLSAEGRGIGHLEGGKTVFVEGALPGETVRIKHMNHKRHYAEAVVDTLEIPSMHRVTPQCAVFGVCGGCVLQHLAPTQQLHHKFLQLQDALTRIAGVTPLSYDEPVTGPAWNYRHKARLGVRWVYKQDRVLIGFRERKTHHLTDMRRCEILPAEVGERLELLQQAVYRCSQRDRIPQIEVAFDEAGFALVFRVLYELTAEDRAVLSELALVLPARLFLQPGDASTVIPLNENSSPTLEYTLPAFDLRLSYSPTDFIQVNPVVNRKMVDLALQWLNVSPADRVLDLFCGIGNFTLALARRAAQVVGVEGDAAMIRTARANAVRNGLTQVEFYTDDLTQNPLVAAWLRSPYDVLLLDPPRTGAEAVIKQIERIKPKRILYVSCHPASLARDAAMLVREFGYTLIRATVLDMFPHTAHVESMALFERDR